MARQKKSKTANIITLLLLLLLLAGSIGAICHFSGIGKDDITDIVNPVFRVEYDGNIYNANTESVITLPTKGQAQFKVKGVDSYKVTVTPNVTPETDFVFEVGNAAAYRFSQTRLSPLFISEDSIRNGSFYLNCLSDYSLESVLSKLYDSAEIKVLGSIECPYLLTFTAKNITIKFVIFVPKITLSESNIIF